MGYVRNASQRCAPFARSLTQAVSGYNHPEWCKFMDVPASGTTARTAVCGRVLLLQDDMSQVSIVSTNRLIARLS
jgi:hypothetical protein